jgi:hypothetical protein
MKSRPLRKRNRRRDDPQSCYSCRFCDVTYFEPDDLYSCRKLRTEVSADHLCFEFKPIIRRKAKTNGRDDEKHRP